VDGNGYQVQAILNTHGHFDHIGAVADLVDKYKCPFYLHSKDGRLLRSANLYMNLFAGEAPVRVPTVDIFLDQVPSPLVLGEFSVEVLYTPGHTDGSVCFQIGDHLFTGDTLLKGKAGRVDLPGGNKEKLETSLQAIAKLPGQLVICPGHGATSSLAEELLTNDSFTRSLT
jgi:hydroxyacylglutathione hydrolase